MEKKINKQKIKMQSKLTPNNYKPMLATLCDAIPNGKNWAFEIKYDGYRILAFSQNVKIDLFTRNFQNYTQKFKKIAKNLQKINNSGFILDGEVVSFDKNGRSDFSLLQENIKENNQNFYYVVFDVLSLDGQDLRNLTFEKRRKKLEVLLSNPAENIVISSLVYGNGKQCFDVAKKANLEGIIAKNTLSKYEGRRSEEWLKIKCYKRQEFVIVGYVLTQKNPVLSAILVGYYEHNTLQYVGKVGTGFDQKTREFLGEKFKKFTQKTCPFETSKNFKNTVWLKPVFVAEIQFAELTKDKLLRQPSFVGLRDDKPAKDVKLEEVL